MFRRIKKDEVVVNANDFGILVEDFVRGCMRPKCATDPNWINEKLREWWPKLEEYYQRHIMCNIEVAIALDEPPRYKREPLTYKEMWIKFVKDLRPPKSAFTVKYHCHKCKRENLKLWRGVHGHPDKDGNELLCATCLAPGKKVDDKGQAVSDDWHDATGRAFPGSESDQINGWLPAVPTQDTFWGYSSVPSQDVEWWQALPTY